MSDYSWDTRKNHRRGRHRRTGKETLTISMGLSSSGDPVAKLRNGVNGALQALGIEVDEITAQVFDEVGKEGADRIREEIKRAGIKGKGKYARGWVYEVIQEKYSGKIFAVIRNKTQPQLAHLLEYGHPIVRNGRVIRQAKAYEHIEPVNQWVQKELETRLKQSLK